MFSFKTPLLIPFTSFNTSSEFYNNRLLWVRALLGGTVYEWFFSTPQSTPSLFTTVSWWGLKTWDGQEFLLISFNFWVVHFRLLPSVCLYVFLPQVVFPTYIAALNLTWFEINPRSVSPESVALSDFVDETIPIRRRCLYEAGTTWMDSK